MSKLSSLHISFSVQADVALGELSIDLRELKRSLRTLADTQSITHAAQSLGVTYRTLWGRLIGFDAALGCKLVGKARGRGTHLTGKGRALLAALERHDELFSPPSTERVSALSADLARALRDQPLLRLIASHDYALAKVFDTSANTAAKASTRRRLPYKFRMQSTWPTQAVWSAFARSYAATRTSRATTTPQ